MLYGCCRQHRSEFYVCVCEHGLTPNRVFVESTVCTNTIWVWVYVYAFQSERIFCSRSSRTIVYNSWVDFIDQCAPVSRFILNRIENVFMCNKLFWVFKWKTKEKIKCHQLKWQCQSKWRSVFSKKTFIKKFDFKKEILFKKNDIHVLIMVYLNWGSVRKDSKVGLCEAKIKKNTRAREREKEKNQQPRLHYQNVIYVWDYTQFVIKDNYYCWYD